MHTPARECYSFSRMGYTLSDLGALSVAFLLFGLFAFAPGYTFGWLANAFGFRRRRLATRLAAAVPLSIGLTPITAYFLWRWSLPLVWIVFGSCGAVCAILLVRDVRTEKLRLSREGWWVLLVAVGWVIVGALSLVDIQIGHRLYFPVSSYDNQLRVPFTAAIAREGIPPSNPFFLGGHPSPLRYHYFWLIPCALIDRLSGSLGSARIAVIAGTLWSGLGLLGLIALYLRFFQAKGGDRIERRTFIAVAFLGVTGLDIVPVLTVNFASHILLPTIEWWNQQISAWITTMIWVPHDLAGLTAGLTGFLLAWDAAQQVRLRRTIVGILVAGLAFASSVGCSVYVGGTVAAGCALWLLVALLKRWWRHAVVLGLAGILAGALLLPFISEVTRGLGGASASSPISFTVRSFPLVDAAIRTTPGKTLALNALFLPLNYFLEFGFFFVVGCVAVREFWRHGFRDRAAWCAAALAAASLFVCTFVQSGVITNNDLGFRSPLVVQFILLLWTVEMWEEGLLGFGPSHAVPERRAAPYLVALAIVLGVLGSSYELCLQRTFPILWDAFGLQSRNLIPPGRQLGRRTFALRSAYQELDRLLPPSAIVQHDPQLEGIGNIPAALYSDRQMVADGGNCTTVFGGSKAFCDDVILPRLKPLFDDRPSVTAAEAAATCRRFSITALLFKDTDPVWKDKASWIWGAQPLLSNEFVRAIECGGSSGKAGHLGRSP